VELSAILNFAGTIILGIIGWMLREMVKDIKTQLADHGQRLNALETERVKPTSIERMEDDLADKVSKEEWLRGHGTMQRDLQEISSKLDQLTGSQDAAVKIASAIAVALNAKRGEQ
jgi:hypothetical protein